MPNPAAARSKAWVCSSSFAVTAVSNFFWEVECLPLVSVLCVFHVEVSETGRSLVQRSPAECGVSECDPETSIMRWPWPTRGCQVMKRSNVEMSSDINTFHNL